MAGAKQRAGGAATATGPKVVKATRLTPSHSAITRRPATRGSAIAVKCRDCCHDSEVAGTWRQQVSACVIVDCALWTFRPLAQGVPDCIAARDKTALPDNWRSLGHEKTIAIIAGKMPDSLHGCAAQANGGISAGLDGEKCQPQFKAAKSGSSEQREGVEL